MREKWTKTGWAIGYATHSDIISSHILLIKRTGPGYLRMKQIHLASGQAGLTQLLPAELFGNVQVIVLFHHAS